MDSVEAALGRVTELVRGEVEAGSSGKIGGGTASGEMANRSSTSVQKGRVKKPKNALTQAQRAAVVSVIFASFDAIR